jgi:hypothetical protein
VGSTLAAAIGGVYVNEADNPGIDASALPAVHRHGVFPFLQPGDASASYEALWDCFMKARIPAAHRTVRGRRLARRAPQGLVDAVILQSLRLSRARPGVPVPVVAKSVFSIFSIDWLVARYQPAVILVRRHPLNMVASWRERGWRAPPDNDTRLLRPRLRQLIAGLGLPAAPAGSELARVAWWIAVQLHVQSLLSARHPDWPMLTHDDAAAAPAATFTDLLAELGIEPRIPIEGYLAGLDRPGRPFEAARSSEGLIDAWRRRLGADELGEVMRVLVAFPEAWWHERLPGA